MRYLSAALLAVVSVSAPAAQSPAAATAAAAPLTLTEIMANPQWIARPPGNPYWSADGKTAYYRQQRMNSELEDLFAADLATGKVSQVGDADISATGSDESAYDRNLTSEVYVAHGDLFLKDVATGKVTELTRGVGTVSDPSFMAGGHSVSFVLDGNYYIRDLASGLTRRAADIETENPPGTPPDTYQYYSAEQMRLFEFLQKQEADEEAQRRQDQALASADASRGPEPFYVGPEVKIVKKSLSPDGRWMLLVTEPAHYNKGPKGRMPNYVTRNGRIQLVPVHRRVGWNDPAPQQPMLLNLTQHKQYPLDLAALPGIEDDPLAALRKQAVAWDLKHGIGRKQAEASVKAPAVRPLQVWGVAWSEDGTRLALELRSIDNKDRWIATVDFAHGMKLVTRNRLTDPAWINWDYNDFGWLADDHTLWYLSEATGYSQLYLDDVATGQTRRETNGTFEVSDPVASRDGRYVYYKANEDAPGIYSLYRLDVASGKSLRLTHLGGMNGDQPSMEGDTELRLSPDGSELLFYHSSMLRPPDLYAVATSGAAPPQRLTDTVTPAFTRIPWLEPRIVRVPSTHFKGSIYARLYVPAGYDPAKSYAGAVFIHGAGYLQDVQQGWSFYFREMMFNNFLTQHGYVVLDMDYRGSKGYGRDWRTAIYRHMGHPEVEDITDGVHWLEKNWHVDPRRLGVYGGSYGGFMTYMMMFRAPGLFRAGAALRPVGDWGNYNDLYTSDILNRPAIDPEAYEISSPIHFAQNLKGDLLIEQGVEDDNVFFQDTVHMVQKLIELKKPNFEMALFPVEHHAFQEPAAWLYEYRNIWKLFCTYVSPRQNCMTDR